MKTTIAILEPVVEKMRGKVKSKSAHVVDSRETEGGETVHIDQVYSIDSVLKSNTNRRVRQPIGAKSKVPVTFSVIYPNLHTLEYTCANV